ncbi:MAG: response regulator [Gammaproteobacteria bacterium]|nr:response regulator [Gammaproteobacteria bacterium]MBU1722596.1 response regulator [Gammaproteobacteria bacterium]MBU2007068.1 response regulator [Gammaproteobacteria bacterium]
MPFFKHKVIATLLVLLVSFSAQAAVRVLVGQETQNISLAPYLELLEDPSGQLDIAQVSSAAYSHRFVANTADVPDFGHTRSAWWVRFQLRSNTPLERYLLLDRPIGGSVEAFVLPAGTKTDLQRLKDYRFPAFHLQLAAGETVSVYLRVSNGKALLTLPLKLLAAEQLISSSNTETLVFAGLFTGMLVLALYNLLLFFSLQDYSYLSLVGFICATGMMFFRDSNLFPTFSWLSDTQHYFYAVPLTLTIASAFQYWGYINQGGNPLLGRLCQWIPPLMLAIIPLTGLLFSVETLLFGFALALIPILIVLISMAALSGHRPTRNTYWAALILIIGALPYVTTQVGWLTYERLFVYLAQGGILLSMLLLSFAQAEQTRWLREENGRIEATSKAKDAFLTTMSHELRTPIHAIIGLADLLRKTTRPEEQSVYLEKLQSSSHHLQGLVDNVLDLSRIGAGRLELETTTFRLDEELDKLHQMFSHTAKQKGLILSVMQAIPPRLQLLGDPVRLKQVLINLLGNALKFTAQGSITLSVRAETGAADGHIRLCFAVADSGIGIGIRQQRDLFQPFTQADSSTARRYGGSGLGLAISRQLVHLMGGELEVESEPENGSRFFFTLDFPTQTTSPVGACPASDSSFPSTAKESLAGQAPTEEGFQGLHVLLVDDDELNRYLGERMLKRLGVKVTLVESGQAALALLQQQRFDLVMMDVSMPEMDGYTTTRLIRQAGHTALPIIAVTAHAIAGEWERCRAAGMDAYLGKPFGLEALQTTLINFMPKA